MNKIAGVSNFITLHLYKITYILLIIKPQAGMDLSNIHTSNLYQTTYSLKMDV